MESKEKKTKAKPATAKDATIDAPKAKRATKSKATEAAAPKAKSKPAAKAKAEAPAVEAAAPKAKSKAAAKAKAEAPAVEAAAPKAKSKPAAKAKAEAPAVEAAAPKAKSKAAAKAKAEAPTVEAAAPKAKSKAAAKAKAEAPTVEAAAPKAKSKPAAKSKAVEAPSVEAAAPKAKSKPAAKSKAAEAPAAEAAATKAKSKAAAKAKAVEAPSVEAAAPKAKSKAAAKAKAVEAAAKAKAVEASAAEAAADAPKAPKVRVKPRRRVLKRMGLWVPKHERKQAAAEARKLGEQPKPKAEQPAAKPKPDQPPKPAPAAKGKENPAPPAKDERRKPASKQEAKALAKQDQRKERETRTEPKPEKRQHESRQLAPADRESVALFDEPIRLNRYVALSGVCSRREADALIVEGKVRVNGKVVKEMGHKVRVGKDVVTYMERELLIKTFVYLLMNKPKNCITTTDDEKGRMTVMELAEKYTKTRVYPVGRLDRNTTGLLLLTNDGDLTLKMTHPSSKFTKLYLVRTDKDVTDADIDRLRKGFELEDGFIKADKVERVEEAGENEIGLQIHSGANHIVKRMMAHLGYEVVALDRVMLGPLTKRGLPRGTCRFLTEKEIGFLKMS